MSARARGKRRGGKEADSKQTAAPGDCLAPVSSAAISAEKLGVAVDRIVAKHAAEMRARVKAEVDQLFAALLQGHVDSSATSAPAADGQEPAPESGTILTVGRLGYLPGFHDVWLDGTHYNLRGRTKARLCIQYLVETKAFDAASARHLVRQIDRYVRQHGRFRRSLDIKIDHYFQGQHGRLLKLRQDLIGLVDGEKRYFLKVRREATTV